MLPKCSGVVLTHFASNRSLISLNNVKVPSSAHYSSSKETVSLISLEKSGDCKHKCGLVLYIFFLKPKR